MSLVSKIFAPVDMTKGTPWKRIAQFTIPMLIGNFAQQLYSTVDSIIVGKYVGDNALAAVGSAFPILNLLLVLFIGISMGASIMISQFFGARDREGLSKTIGSSIFLTICSSLIVMVVGSLVARPLLIMLNTPASILDWCTQYLVISFLGVMGMSFYNILSGALRGLGDSFSALVFLIVASVINIVLDIVFVAFFGMGVAGVALATIIAQSFSAVLCIFRLRSMNDLFDMKLSFVKWDSRYAGGIIRLGVPSGVTQAIISMAMLIVQPLTNSFGEQFIAANVILQRVDGFAMLPNFSFGAAMTTYAGQNIGAKNMDRVNKGTKEGLALSIGTSVVVTALILVFGRQLMGIFTDTEVLVDLSMQLMRILAVGYIAMGVSQVLGGVMRGAGDTMTPMWISIVQTVVVRVPLAYILIWLSKSPEYPIGRQELLYVSLLGAWVAGMIINLIAYKLGKWRNKAYMIIGK